MKNISVNVLEDVEKYISNLSWKKMCWKILGEKNIGKCVARCWKKYQ